MADNKKSAYGTASSDTSFRRTWDHDEYAAKAAARAAREREESKARYEAKISGKKYHPPPPPASLAPSDKGKGKGNNDSKPPAPRASGDDVKPGGDDEKNGSFTDARAARLNVSAQVGKTQMLSAAQAGVGKRGRGAGFYCEACDLTFKDNLQWVEHLNSKGHLVQTGQSGEVRRVGVEEVRKRLAELKKRRDDLAREREGEGVELGERLRIRKEKDDEEREEKRRIRREKRRAGGAGNEGGVKMEKGEDGEQGDEEMMKLMGFGGVGSTRVPA
ncbi:MAG: U4/U6.U5 snRNP associated protein [Sclerophora amabilis]|nr:MAG: U4/U6.U5 snRNP associated protein [Sclerophora amabilis]